MPTSARENRQKEASRRRKPAGLLNPARRDSADGEASQEGPQGAAQTLAQALAKTGVVFDQKIWDFLPDGTGICLKSGETMTVAEVDEFKATAARHKAAGYGIRFKLTG
jgi:hypothetical protein